MGRRAVKKENQKHVRTVWKTVERTVKRSELDTIASICGATRETIGSVICDAILTDEYNDDRDECTERERSISDGSTTTATAGSDKRDPTTNHRL